MAYDELYKHGKKFSKDYQPTPEAKSKGSRAYWDRRKLKDRLCEEFAKEIMSDKEANGKKITTWEAFFQFLKVNLLGKDSGITKADKAKLMLKILEFVAPKDVDSNISFEEVPKFLFEVVSANKKEKEVEKEEEKEE